MVVAYALVFMWGFIVMMSWGVGEYKLSQVTTTYDTIRLTVVLYTSICVTSSALLVLVVVVHHPAGTAPHGAAIWYIYACVTGLSLTLGSLLVNMAYARGPVTIAGPLAGVYPLAMVGVALLVFDVHLMRLQLIGAVITVVGMAAVTFIVGYKDKKKDEEDTSKKGRLRGPMLAIAGAGIWGVGFELLARATPYLGLAVSTLLYLGSAFVSAWLILLVAQLLGRLPATPTLTDAFKDKAPRMAGAILAVGYVAEIIGFEAERLTHTGGVITITIASCCSGIIAYLAIKRGGEKFEAGKMPWVIGGVAILIAGVALLLV